MSEKPARRYQGASAQPKLDTAKLHLGCSGVCGCRNTNEQPSRALHLALGFAASASCGMAKSRGGGIRGAGSSSVIYVPHRRMQLNMRRALSATRRKRSGGAMRDRLAALAAVAAAGAILSCSNAGTPDIDSQQDRGSSAGKGQDQPGATLYPIRYGYRGGPYTSGGKPRPTTGPGEATPTAPM